MTIQYRRATEADRPFIVSAWSSSFRDSYTAGMIAMSDWATVMRPQIERVLDREGSVTIVAQEEGVEMAGLPVGLHGFIHADITRTPPLVFYVYVKQAYRRLGIARELFKAIGVAPDRPFDYACRTMVLADLTRKIPLARWQPLAARFPPREPPKKNKDGSYR